MNYIFILFLIFFYTNISYANNIQEVSLQNYDIKTLKTPEINYEKKYSIGDEEDDSEYFFSQEEDDIFENKAGKVFSKFINDRVINSKINTFTEKLTN